MNINDHTILQLVKERQHDIIREVENDRVAKRVRPNGSRVRNITSIIEEKLRR